MEDVASLVLEEESPSGLSLHDVHRALAQTRREKEAVWGEYLKLQAREESLEAQAAGLADRLARELLARSRREDLRTRLERPARSTVACSSCGRAVRPGSKGAEFSGSGLVAHCGSCLTDARFLEAMEEAENG